MTAIVTAAVVIFVAHARGRALVGGEFLRPLGFVTRMRFKRMTCCLEGSCSIQLSYRVEKSPGRENQSSKPVWRPETAAKLKKKHQGAKKA